jgi:uncharacterized protein YbcI
MQKPVAIMAKQIAQAASEMGKKRTGLKPKGVTVVQSDGTLVITLHGALSPAEIELSRTPDGALQVQEYHRELFSSNAAALREEIKRITGVEVREATAEVDPSTGSVVAVFATGTVVQVFLLKNEVSDDAWDSGVTDGTKG